MKNIKKYSEFINESLDNKEDLLDWFVTKYPVQITKIVDLGFEFKRFIKDISIGDTEEEFTGLMYSDKYDEDLIILSDCENFVYFDDRESIKEPLSQLNNYLKLYVKASKSAFKIDKSIEKDSINNKRLQDKLQLILNQDISVIKKLNKIYNSVEISKYLFDNVVRLNLDEICVPFERLEANFYKKQLADTNKGLNKNSIKFKDILRYINCILEEFYEYKNIQNNGLKSKYDEQINFVELLNFYNKKYTNKKISLSCSLNNVVSTKYNSDGSGELEMDSNFVESKFEISYNQFEEFLFDAIIENKSFNGSFNGVKSKYVEL